MRKQGLVAISIAIAITMGSLGISLAAEPPIVPNDPLVDTFMQSDIWWTLKSQRDMAIDERISNVMNLGSHNSFNASAEGFKREFSGLAAVQPNQLFTIVDQLRMGVRLIELDVYDLDLESGGKILVVKHKDIIWGLDGSDWKEFDDCLYEIRDWLEEPENEKEIVFLDIEDGASGNPLFLEEIKIALVDRWETNDETCPDLSEGMIFTPWDRLNCFSGRWPTRRELLDLGKRVIMFNHGDLSDGPYRFFSWYSEEDQRQYEWWGSDYSFFMGPHDNPGSCLTDKTIEEYWDGNNLPPEYQQDLSRFFAVRSDGLMYGPRAMVGVDVAYCVMNNVNFIKMDFLLGQEYDIDDKAGTSANDYDTPGGWDNDWEIYSYLDNIRGNREGRAIWSWQIDAYVDPTNIHLSQQILHSPTAKEANRQDGRHYVVQEGFPFDPDTPPYQSIISPDPLIPVVTRGHWNTEQRENVHCFACAKVGSDRTEWRITERAGPWDEGAKVCDEEFNNKDEGAWVFAGPVNGYQNLLLLTARWMYAKQDPNRIAVAEEPVWINVSDEDNDADWTVRETGAPMDEQDVQVWPGGGDGGLCFIATAAYGSHMAEEVRVFQKVRDEYLLTHELGRAFVSGYYKYSPPLADWIAKHPAMRRMVRIGLYPVLELSKWLVGEKPSE